MAGPIKISVMLVVSYEMSVFGSQVLNNGVSTNEEKLQMHS